MDETNNLIASTRALAKEADQTYRFILLAAFTAMLFWALHKRY